MNIFTKCIISSNKVFCINLLDYLTGGQQKPLRSFLMSDLINNVTHRLGSHQDLVGSSLMQ